MVICVSNVTGYVCSKRVFDQLEMLYMLMSSITEGGRIHHNLVEI